MIRGFLADARQIVIDFIMHMPFAFIRNFCGRLIFKKMAKGAQLSRHIHIICPQRISLGENVFINRNVVLDGRQGLEIGDNTDVGEFSSIWSLQHNPDENNHKSKGGVTCIEDHVWIAPHSIILPGVKVSRGAVIATGSVVTKDVDPLCVVGGVPARFIKKRNNDLHYQLKYKIYF